jgi:Zn-finger nucleic acid-binding protein
MLCPNCSSPLVKKVYKGVQVEECETCKGIFLDKKEFDKAKNNTDSDLSWLDFAAFALEDKNLAVKESLRTCPRCTHLMHAYEYAGSKVIINMCSDCKGIWLDHEEFNAIIHYLESLVVKHPSVDYVEDIKRQLMEVVVGPKSEQEELRDLFTVTRLFEMRFIAEHPTLEKILETYFELTPFK